MERRVHEEIDETLRVYPMRLVPVPDRPLEVAYTSTAYPTRLSMTAVSR